LKIANICATVLLLIGACVRTAYVFGEGFNFFLMITTFYMWFFIIVFGISEAPDSMKIKGKLLMYFNFLDR